MHFILSGDQFFADFHKRLRAAELSAFEAVLATLHFIK